MKSLLYIANLRLPTEKAYGIQIAKMCEAFADPELKFKVALIYPKRNNPNIKENVFDYYSVKNNFEAKRVWAPDFYFSGKLDTISVLIKNFISAIFFMVSMTKDGSFLCSFRGDSQGESVSVRSCVKGTIFTRVWN